MPEMVLTNEQRRYLQEILNYLREQSRWPTHQYLEQLFLKIEPDLDIEEIVPGMQPDLTNAVDLNFPSNKAMLTIPAIYALQKNAPELDAFLQVIKLCVDVYMNSEAANQRVSSQFVQQQYPTWRETAIRKVGLLLAVEPGIWKSFGSGDSGWSCELTRYVRRFRDISTIEDYLEKREIPRKTVSTMSMVEALSSPVPASFTITVQNDIRLHPDIYAKCWNLYTRADYDNAILNATKALEAAVRKKAGLADHVVGVEVMNQAFRLNSPILRYSAIPAEQEGMMALLRGIIQVYKNPHSHRFVDVQDKSECLGILLTCSNLLYTIDNL